ncbi:hypothetical protein TRVA0_019S00298 [Trichomonascus vanleenenianus]|uniref:F-box/WD repeat-containing protein n=1 Tax=Trichomonascus vanleenenianus TaxID=2268995 RepID=UPI003ECAD487
MTGLIVSSTGRKHDPAAVLPPAVMRKILYMLPLKDFFQCRTISKRWRKAVMVSGRFIKILAVNLQGGHRNNVTSYVLRAKQEIKLRWRTGQAFMSKFVGHIARVTGIEVYLPLNVLISCSMDNTIRFWDINHNVEVHRIGDEAGARRDINTPYAHANGVSAMHLFGNSLVTADTRGKVIVWKIAKPVEPAFYRILRTGVAKVCSNYFWIVCVLQNNYVAFIDRYQPYGIIQEEFMQTGEITSIDFNEKYLATSCRNGTVVVWKLATRTPVYQCNPATSSPVLNVKFCLKLDRLICHTAVRVIEWHIECPRFYRREKASERVWHIGIAGNCLVTAMSGKVIATNLFTREKEGELQLPFAYDKGESLDLWRTNFRYIAYTVSDVLSTSIRFVSFYR